MWHGLNLRHSCRGARQMLPAIPVACAAAALGAASLWRTRPGRR
ncbi:hypothetical protein HDA43_002028 [Streptosporangium sandarakinum]|uniref:Uncharacterized protein n=1 Tax=Streptosporangium sandarakinum TaxID=1260955 RepID=A0A852UUE8_9ACTN|nr:hypothetical protein [Streptosporangium sandarakinum]